ncbi:DUF418 domain-containing protein, partial [bacterium]|nr:DUF418 domain-containing protein [bacterium]
MLIGMALYRFGFFAGAFPIATMRRWGWGGVAVGLGLSLPPGLWAISRDFPPFLTDFVFNGAPQLPRLPMILGLAALLSIAAPGALAAQGLGGNLARRLGAAGRMAFSNYIGTSFLMMLVFRSWALGGYGRLDRLELLLPMALCWLVMLAWSQPW